MKEFDEQMIAGAIDVWVRDRVTFAMISEVCKCNVPDEDRAWNVVCLNDHDKKSFDEIVSELREQGL